MRRGWATLSTDAIVGTFAAAFAHNAPDLQAGAFCIPRHPAPGDHLTPESIRAQRDRGTLHPQVGRCHMADLDAQPRAITTERERIEADLIESARHAKRQPYAFGTVDHPSKWDEAHTFLDLLLDDWQAAR